MGRGAHAFLAHRKDVVSVRVVATREFKIKTVMERDGLSHSEAVKQIKRKDEQRALYTKRHYGQNWASEKYYHLIVNTGLTGVDAAATIVAKAAKRMLMGEE